ncbi:GtrA family protein [Devosia marina]|uniref:GtrA family protein n=1 Tax=Devosia marina TaxID=2683198 RepID=A0A7X3FNP2_9HYPH|nr:GtrA family protein [Devosia marina]MVS97923.1 GtrA family protein [Devosia marina]
MLSNQFVRFLLTGGFAAAVNIGSRYLLNFVMPFEYAVVIAYLCGMATAFVLAKLFVFTASGRSTGSEFTRFLIVNLFALGLTWVISVCLARFVFPVINFTWNADDIAHIIGVLAPAVTSFLGHRYYSFRRA